MSTVVYLSNQEVRVVIGRQSGNTISVDAAIRENAPEGSIINGQVLNEEAFTEFLADFWERYRLPVKDVTLVLGSARTVVKAIAVPQLPYRKMMNYLPHEFACAKPENDAMYTYDVLFREGEKYRVFAGKMERGFLRQHILRFQKLGIRISSASIGMMMNIKMIQRIPHLQDKTCVVQMADGLNLVSILLVQGRYYHFTSSRVFASQGSMAFGWEIARGSRCHEVISVCPEYCGADYARVFCGWIPGRGAGDLSGKHLPGGRQYPGRNDLWKAAGAGPAGMWAWGRNGGLLFYCNCGTFGGEKQAESDLSVQS